MMHAAIYPHSTAAEDSYGAVLSYYYYVNAQVNYEVVMKPSSAK